MTLDREKLLAVEAKQRELDEEIVELQKQGKQTQAESLKKRAADLASFAKGTKPAIPTAGRRTLSEDVDGTATFDDYRARGVRDVLASLGRMRGQRRLAETLLSIDRGPAARPDPTQAVMLRVAERRAATLYRHAADAGDVSNDDLENPAVDEALRNAGSGAALPEAVKKKMEAELDISLDRVRIHTDAVAADATRAVRADAFTVGEDIFFSAGAFAPESKAGQRLIAHELAHVVQAYQGRTERSGAGVKVSVASDALEVEAERIADRIERGDRRSARTVESRAIASERARSNQISAPAIPQRGVGQTPIAPAVQAPGRTLMRRPAANAAPANASADKNAAGPNGPNANQNKRDNKPHVSITTDHNATASLRNAARAGKANMGTAQAALGQQVSKVTQQQQRHFHDEVKQATKHDPSAKAGVQHETEHKKAHEQINAVNQHAATDPHHQTHGGGGDHHAPAGDRPDTNAPIQFKKVSDWNKFLPAPMRDADDREKAHLLDLTKKKVEGDRAQSQHALMQLRKAQLQQAGSIRASKAGLVGQIAGAQGKALGTIAQAEAAQCGSVQSHTASMQAMVRGAAAAMKGTVNGAHTAAIAAINTAAQGANQELAQAKATALTQVTGKTALQCVAISLKYMAAQTKIRGLGAQKAAQAQGVQASLPYSGDKLEAAEKAATDTRNQYASSMTEHGNEAATELGTHTAQSQTEARTIADAHKDAINQAFDQCKQAVDDAKKAATEAAHQAKTAALAAIDSAAAGAISGLGTAGAQAVAGIRSSAASARTNVTKTGGAAQGAIGEAVTKAATEVEKGAHGLAKGAHEVEQADPEETKKSVADAMGSLKTGSKKITAELHKSAGSSAAGLGTIAAETAKGMAAAASAANASSTQMANGAKNGINQIGQQAAKGLQETAKAFSEQAKNVVKNGNKAFTDMLTALQTTYTQQGTQLQQGLDQNYGQIKSQFDQAVPGQEQADIQKYAKKAADAVKPWWQKALAVVVSIVVAIVVVVAVAALVTVTGPVGLAIVGAVGGALASVASQMASNLVLGNGLTEGISWQSIAIGAVAGAITGGLGPAIAGRAATSSVTWVANAGRATTVALEGGSGVGNYAIRFGVNVGQDFVNDFVTQVGTNLASGKGFHYEFSMQNLVTSMITNGITQGAGFNALKGAGGSGRQIAMDLGADAIGQVGGSVATGHGAQYEFNANAFAQGYLKDHAGPNGGPVHQPGAGSNNAGPPGHAGANPGHGSTSGHAAPNGPAAGHNGPAAGHSGDAGGSAANAGGASSANAGGAPGGQGSGSTHPSGSTGANGGANAGGANAGGAPAGQAHAGSSSANAGGGSAGGGAQAGRPGRPGAHTSTGGGEANAAGGSAAGHANGNAGGGAEGGAHAGAAENTPTNHAANDNGHAGGAAAGAANDNGSGAAAGAHAGAANDNGSAAAGNNSGGAAAAGGAHANDNHGGGAAGGAHAGAAASGAAPGGAHANANENHAAAHHDDAGGAHAGGDEAAPSAHDNALHDLNYDQGTAQQGHAAADRVAAGEPATHLRDTEANQRGAQDLNTQRNDSTMTPERKNALNAEVANQMRGNAEPTGNLAADVAAARTKVDQSHPLNTEGQQPNAAQPATGGQTHANETATHGPTTVADVQQRKAAGETWSNKEIRDNYNAQNSDIARQNSEWKAQGLTAQERAERAHAARHEMRMTAREQMGDPRQQLELLIRDAQKYGDGEGPSLAQLVEQQRVKHGRTGDDAYEAIIDSSQRTDAKTNQRVESGDADRAPNVTIPEGVTMSGDGARVQGASGEVAVRIRQEDGQGPARTIRNEDGSFEIRVGKQTPHQVALDSTAAELGRIREQVAGQSAAGSDSNAASTSTNTTQPSDGKTDGGASGAGFGSGRAAGTGSGNGTPASSGTQVPRATGAATAGPVTAAPTITHQTEHMAMGGDGNDRSLVGVGEHVTFRSTTAGTWTTTAWGTGGQQTGRGPTFAWVAPSAGASATITFDPGSGAATIPTTMTVIAPSEVHFRKYADETFGPGIAGAGMYSAVTVGPFTVSFARLAWRELPGPGTLGRGYFDGIALPDHAPRESWLNLDESHHVGGSRGGDYAEFHGFESPWESGSYRWHIPNNYKVRGESTEYLITNIDQICSLEGAPNAGRTTVTKGEAHSTRAVAAAPAAPPARGRTTRGGSGFAHGEGGATKKDDPAKDTKPAGKADEEGKPNATGANKQKAGDDSQPAQQTNKPAVKDPAKKEGGKGAANANKVGGDAANANKSGKQADPADVGAANVKGSAVPAKTNQADPAQRVTTPVVSAVPQLTLDPPKVTKGTADKWLKETGRTPEQHAAQIQSALQIFQSDVQASQTELQTAGDTEATKVTNDVKAKVDTFKTSAIAAGHNRVASAFDGMGKTLDAQEKVAIASIATHKKTGAASITTASTTQNKGLADKFAAAKKAGDQHRTKAKPLIVQTITAFAQSIKKESVEKAKTDAQKVGDDLSATKKPESFDGTNAYEGGHNSLVEDVSKQKLKDHGKQLGEKYEAQLKGFGSDAEKKADVMITKSLEPAALDLTLALDVADKQSKGGMEGAAKTATANLDAQEKTATKAVTDAKVSTTKKIADDKKAALDLADKSGTEFADNTTAAGTEFTDRIKAKVADDAKGYAKLVTDIQKNLRTGGPFKYEQIEPKLTAAKAQLTTQHAENTTGLSKMVVDGTKTLGESLGKLETTYNDAIKEREADAKKLDGDIAKEMNKSATEMGATLGSIGTTFVETANAETKKIDTAVAEFNASATTLLTEFDKKVTTQLQKAKLDLDTELATNLVPAKFEEDTRPEIMKAVGAKEKTLQKDAGGLRDAMDGWGTDENKIYGIMRKCSYGEIEYLEATYNEHYPERAKKGMRPLRYDLNDEMSGNELKIALSYLDHDRKTAIKLELDDSCRWYNDDEARIEEVLRGCSEDEITFLNTDEGAKKIVKDTRSALGGCDLDTMDALLDQKIKTKEERATKANAIRLYDAMSGVGTDEAKVKALLEGAATKEERDRLRAEFNKYAALDKNKLATAQEWGTGDGKDMLDKALDEEFSGGEKTLVNVLAKSDRDEQEVKMAKAIDAVDGAGTNEDQLMDSLDDTSYNEKWVLAKKAAEGGDPAAVAALKKLEEDHQLELDKKLKGLGSEGMQALIDGDTDKNRFTYQEFLDGKYKDGKPLDKATCMPALKMGIGLEWMVMQRKLQTGAADPELLLAYACYGDGTNEELINKVLAPGGESQSRSGIADIKAAFQKVWGEPLVVRDELAPIDWSFPSPGGLLDAELSGKDWNKTRVYLCGKAESPEQLKYVGKLQAKFATSGLIGGAVMDFGEAIGFTEAKTTLQNTDKRFDAKYTELEDAFNADPKNKGKEFGKAKLTDMIAIGGEQLERYAEYLAQDADAYSRALTSIVDTLCTVLEIVGGIILTVVTAGTASPVLAAIIGNLIISGVTIAIKAAALGDNYGAAELGADVIKAVGTAGFAGLGEVKALKSLTDAAGAKATGMLFTTVKDGVNAGGGKLVGTSIELGPKAIQNVQKIVAAGTKNVIISSGQEVYNTLTDEKTYDKKLGEALWGEDSLGARLIKGIPKAFVEGAVKQAVDEAAGVSNVDNKGRVKNPITNMLGNAMSDMISQTAGFLVYVDNYKDAEAFWKELLKTNAKAGVQGFAVGWGMHKARAKKTGRDFLNGEMTAEGLKEMLKVLDAHEQKELADFVKKLGTPAQYAALPEEFKKAAGHTVPPPAPPAPKKNDPNDPDTKPDAEIDPQADAAKKQQAEKEAAAKKKQLEDEAAAKKRTEDEAAAKKKAHDEEVAREAEAKKKQQHEEEVARKKQQEEAAAAAAAKKKADDEAAAKKAADDIAAKKKAADEEAERHAAQQAAKKAAEEEKQRVAKEQAEKDAAQKKLHEEAAALKKQQEAEAYETRKKELAAKKQREVDEAWDQFLAEEELRKKNGGADLTDEQKAELAKKKAAAKKTTPDGNETDQSKTVKKTTGTPRQNVETLDQVYEQAAIAKPQLDALTDAIAGEFHGDAKKAPLKGRETAQKKINADYEGDAARITDIARSTVVFDSPEALQKALAAIKERAEIVRIKDRFENPADGYRDVMLNIRMPNGHIVEMQLHLKAVLEVKDGPGHALYEEIRKIDQKAKAENRKLTPEEATKREQIRQQMEKLYDDAVAKAQKPVVKPTTEDDIEEAKKKAAAKKDGESGDEDDASKKTPTTKEPELDATGNIKNKPPGVKMPETTDRQNVPDDVPINKAELLALVRKMHPELVEKYEKKAKSDSGPAFDALIAELEKMKPGSMGKVAGDDEKTAANAKRDAEILKKWTDTAGEQAKTHGNEAELRVIYNEMEKKYFAIWEQKLAHLPKEAQARMLHMYREELKDYIRVLMSDDKSKKVLYLRDRAVYGSEKGPRFDALVDQALADKKTNGDPDAAYQKVMEDAKRSNKGVNKNTTGDESGLKTKTKTQVAVEEQVDQLKKMQHEIDGADGEKKVKLQAELDRLKTDPEWQNAFQLADLFKSAGAQQGKKVVDPETKALSDNIEGLLSAQTDAKKGKDPVLQGKRDAFERKIALEILKDGPVKQAVDAELEKLCAKALDYIQRTRAADDQQKALSDLSTKSSKGYGGGLGTGDQKSDADMIMVVLQTGNIRERMLALQNFAQLVGTDLLTPAGRKKIEEMSKTQSGDDDKKFSQDEAKRLIERVTQYEKDQTDEKKRDVKGLFNPNSEEKKVGGIHEDYADAKSQPMDTKLPPLVAEKVAAFLKQKAVDDPQALSGKGEDSPLARTTITVREALAKGLNLSDREIAAAGGLDAPLNWVVGSVANIVNPNAKFIKDAKEGSMPLKAGVSGTTYRWMQIVDMLGGDPNLARLAAIASLQGADAHSFHEIAFAAKGFGLAYDATNPYGNVGIPPAVLEELAKQVGTSMEELNGKTKKEPPK